MEIAFFIVSIFAVTYILGIKDCDHSWIYHNKKGYKKCYYCNKKEQINKII